MSVKTTSGRPALLSHDHRARRELRSQRLTTRVFHALVVLSLGLPNFAGMVVPAEAAPNRQESPTATETATPTMVDTLEPTATVTETPEPTLADTVLPLASPTTWPPLSPEAEATQSAASADVMFIENQGQFDNRALFQVDGTEGAIHLTGEAIWLTLLEEPPVAATQAGPPPEGQVAPATPVRGVHLRLSFPGASLSTQVVGFGPVDSKLSYFLGDDPEDWHPDVPVWRGVRYLDLYPGIDLELTSGNGAWDWRLVVREGSAETLAGVLPHRQAPDGHLASGIALRVEGSDGLSLEGDRVTIANGIRPLVLPLPEVVRVGTSVGEVVPTIAAMQDGDEVFVPLLVFGSELESPPSETPTPEVTPTETAVVTPEATAEAVGGARPGGGRRLAGPGRTFDPARPHPNHRAERRPVERNGRPALLHSSRELQQAGLRRGDRVRPGWNCVPSGHDVCCRFSRPHQVPSTGSSREWMRLLSRELTRRCLASTRSSTQPFSAERYLTQATASR